MTYTILAHEFNSTVKEISEQAERLCLNPKTTGPNKVVISSVGTFDEAFLNSRAALFFCLGLSHQDR